MLNGHKKDVLIRAPLASSGARNDFGLIPGLEPPTPEEMCQMLEVENRELRDNVKRHDIASGTMAAIALCFAQMLVDANVMRAGDRTVKIPRDLYLRMHGCVITASTEAVTRGGDVLVTIRERPDVAGIES